MGAGVSLIAQTFSSVGCSPPAEFSVPDSQLMVVEKHTCSSSA